MQPALLSLVNALPEKRRQRLEGSWAGSFRREFFARLREQPFAVLYSVEPSRPNVAVNVLVGLEMLKAGHGWSDEELFDHFHYDLQVRFALGYDSLDDGDCELRSLYNFRHRLSQYNQAHGTNLLAEAFVDVTDQQIQQFAVQTGQQRMDSTQIASNIVALTRLQLMVEAVQRLQRLLTADERPRYAETLAPYLAESAGHYAYRVRGQAAVAEHSQALAQVLYRLLADLQAEHAQERPYQVALRFFSEQCRVEHDTVCLKTHAEMTGGNLQSLDDLEATYRQKHGVTYRGYVANVCETCEPGNPLQLITQVAVAPNNVGDSTLLAASMPELSQRTALHTLYTDGGYGGPESDPVLRAQGVQLLQTGISGPPPTPEHLHLADFAIAQNAQGQPMALTCPRGQTLAVTPSPRGQCYNARFDSPACQACPLRQAEQCPPHRFLKQRGHLLRLTQAEVDTAVRRRHSQQLRSGQHNRRAAVEATVRSLKHPFRAGKLPVRGLFRVTCLMLGSAAMTNVRRIQRYLAGPPQPVPNPEPDGPDRPAHKADHAPATPLTRLANLAHLRAGTWRRAARIPASLPLACASRYQPCPPPDGTFFQGSQLSQPFSGPIAMTTTTTPTRPPGKTQNRTFRRPPIFPALFGVYTHPT